jgi:DNA-binding response OmpR family regulator
MPHLTVKILIVEKEAMLGYMVKDYLQKHYFDVTLCTDGDEAWRLFMKNNYDICMLDVQIPGRKDGLVLARNIRKKNKDLPIILVSSRNTEFDRITGLETGADDYLPKPYNMEVLTKRIHVFLKRREKSGDTQLEPIMIGDFAFDYHNLILRNNKVEHQLTIKEANLVRYLCLNPNRLIKREDILTNIWGKDDYFLGRSMDVFITKIRKYFKEHEEIKIQTIHGIGYRFCYKFVA